MAPAKADPDARIVWKTPKPAPQRVSGQADEAPALNLVNCGGAIVSNSFYFCPGEPYTVTATFSNSGGNFEGDLYMLLMMQDTSDGTLYICHQSEPAAASIAQGGQQQVTFQGQIEADMPYSDSYFVGFTSDLSNLIFTEDHIYAYAAIVGAPVIIEEVPSAIVQGQGACTVRLRNITGTDWSGDVELWLNQQGLEWWITAPAAVSVPQGQAIDLELHYETGEASPGSYLMRLSSIVYDEAGEAVSYSIYMADGEYWEVEVKEAVPASATIDGITYTTDPATQTATVTGYEGEPVDVAILASVAIDGADYPVTAIGDNAFQGCSSLTSITLPEGLQNIGNRAFTLCTSLEAIELPASLSAIGYRAFSSCESLRSIAVPEGITTLGIYTFSSCHSLESVTLPSTLQSMDDGIFSGCLALADLTCNAMTPPVINGSLFSDDLMYEQVALHVPSEAEDAYRAAEGWKEFFQETEPACTLLYEADPATQTATVTGYEGTPVDVVIPATVNIDGADYAVAAVGNNAFNSCPSLQSIAFPGGLQSIGTRAFRYCTSLTSIVLPEGVQRIGKNAFKGCESLQSLILPSTLESMGDEAFIDCHALADITCNAMIPPVLATDAFDASVYAEADFHVPAGAEDAYREAEYWKKFYIPSAVIDGIVYQLDETAQAATATGYEGDPVDVVILGTVNLDGADYPVTAVGEEAFMQCFSIESVVISEGVAAIHASAFFNCGELESVVLPGTLQSIGRSSFSVSYSLRSIAIHAVTPPAVERWAFDGDIYTNAVLVVPEGAEAAYRAADGWKEFFFGWLVMDGIRYAVDVDAGTAMVYEGNASGDVVIPAVLEYEGGSYPVISIKESAFFNRVAMTSIVLPEGLKTIGVSAFEECHQLADVAFPSTLRDIGNYAFRRCRALQSVVLSGCSDLIVGSDAFYGCTAMSELLLGEGLQGLGDGAFGGCDALTSVVLPDRLQSIGNSVFSNCESLQSVILPEGLQSIGDYAFAYCPLQSIVLPEGLQTIGDNAFESTTLQSVVLPEGLQSIGNGAFYWCLALESVTLPSTLQSLGGGAFLDCPLKDVTSLAAVPPVMEEGDSFDEDTYATATLHVPSNAVDDYQAAEYWKQFLNIEGNLPPVGIGSVAADAPLAIYANDVITTASPATITVYAQSGARVMRAADATQLSLEALPRGIYIIDVEAGTERQVIKVAH